ncbi:MAG: hypothetical protein RJA98_309 [Pseudomonadota bacterium]
MKKIPAILLLRVLIALVMLLEGGSPIAFAQSATPKSRCTEYGGSLECIKGDIWFESQVGPAAIVGKHFLQGTDACAAIVAPYGFNGGFQPYRSPKYWADYPGLGVGCEYSLYAAVGDGHGNLVGEEFVSRSLSQNWVLPPEFDTSRT